MSALLAPSVADLIFLGCLVLALMHSARMISGDGDPSRHLTLGEYMLTTRSIPRADLFSHTMAGQPFVPYEWLSEVSSAAAYRIAGWAGTVLLHGAAIGAAFALSYVHTRSRGAPVLLAAAVTCLAVAASTLHWLARPHVFSFLGTAFFLYVLDGWQAGRLSRRWLWLMPAAMLLWANLHGGFLLGLIVLGAYLGADVVRWLSGSGTDPMGRSAIYRLRLLAPAAAATLLATLVNPAGIGLLGHVTGYLGLQLLVDRTIEYQSPDFHQADARAFLGMLLLVLPALSWSRRRPELHEVLLLVGFSYFALYSARNIPLFALVVAPILASQIAGLPGPRGWAPRFGRLATAVNTWFTRRNAAYERMERRASTGAWAAAAVGALLLLANVGRASGATSLGVDVDPRLQPVQAVGYLKLHPPAGNGFNQLVWGGYLLHELWPAQRVFIDGQTDFYGEDLTREYLRVAELQEGWQEVLDQHQIEWVLFNTESPLVRTLAGRPGWGVAYQDALATVLVRRRSGAA